MTRSIIVAMARDRVIGDRGRIPWHVPADLAQFKRRTMGKPLVVGRKTWESIGRPLPGRQMIVITRQSDYPLPDGVARAASLAQALQLAAATGADEAFLAGGAEIYRAALEADLVDRMYVTTIDGTFAGDVHFPDIDLGRWRLVDAADYAADERNPQPFRVATYERAR